MGKTLVYSSTQHNNFVAQLCDLYGSDKGTASINPEFIGGWTYHDYTKIYEMVFHAIRFNVTRILEVGIGTNNPTIQSSMGINGTPGASLRVWRDYFPLAEVIGIDIDSDILFSENRIQTFQCDQTDPISIGNFLNACPTKEFDIIIDDGLHTEEAAQIFFENTYTKLVTKGLYFIEDAVWWKGGEIKFLEEKGLRYFVFGDPVSDEIDIHANWNKLIMILNGLG
jgi:hypothetical protein